MDHMYHIDYMYHMWITQTTYVSHVDDIYHIWITIKLLYIVHHQILLSTDEQCRVFTYLFACIMIRISILLFTLTPHSPNHIITPTISSYTPSLAKIYRNIIMCLLSHHHSTWLFAVFWHCIQHSSLLRHSGTFISNIISKY